MCLCIWPLYVHHPYLYIYIQYTRICIHKNIFDYSIPYIQHYHIHTVLTFKCPVQISPKITVQILNHDIPWHQPSAGHTLTCPNQRRANLWENLWMDLVVVFDQCKKYVLENHWTKKTAIFSVLLIWRTTFQQEDLVEIGSSKVSNCAPLKFHKMAKISPWFQLNYMFSKHHLFGHVVYTCIFPGCKLASPPNLFLHETSPTKMPRKKNNAPTAFRRVGHPQRPSANVDHSWALQYRRWSAFCGSIWGCGMCCVLGRSFFFWRKDLALTMVCGQYGTIHMECLSPTSHFWAHLHFQK